MQRKHDWKQRLTSFVASVARREFCPGQHDCALFVAGAVEAMTGEDHAARWRGSYDTLEQGYRLVRSEGYDAPSALLSDVLNEIPVAFARFGDIAVIPAGNDVSFGVVQGEFIWCVRDGDQGIGLCPLTDAARMFRI